MDKICDRSAGGRPSTQKARAPPTVKMPAVCRISREQGLDSGRITSPSDHPRACRSAIAFLDFSGERIQLVCWLTRALAVLTVEPFLVLLLPDKSTEVQVLSFFNIKSITG